MSCIVAVANIPLFVDTAKRGFDPARFDIAPALEILKKAGSGSTEFKKRLPLQGFFKKGSGSGRCPMLWYRAENRERISLGMS